MLQCYFLCVTIFMLIYSSHRTIFSKGVVVLRASSLAKAAGLAAGDIIRFVNNQPVKTLAQFKQQYSQVGI